MSASEDGGADVNRQQGDEEWRVWYGIYYCVPCWRPVLWIWRHVFCKKGWHLWDEMMTSSEEGGPKHTVVCDACQAEIWLTRVEGLQNRWGV